MVFNGKIHIAFFAVSNAPIVIGYSITGIEFYCLGKVFNGQLSLTFGAVNRTAIAIRDGMAWIEVNTLRVRFYCHI